MSGKEALLEARELVVTAGGRTILDVGSFELREGEIMALLGPNGSGKTTLLMCLAALKEPGSGTVKLRGSATGFGAEALAYRRRTSAVFQEPLLLNSTVRENVVLGLKLRGMESGRAVAENLERFGICHLAERNCRSLSGGEAQRVSLARAFAVSPEIVFLDEPFSALDAPTREELAGDLRRTIRATGVAAVFVTHDRNEALALADRITIMREGKAAQTGAPEEVATKPADEFIAAFMGMETLLSGEVKDCEEGLTTVIVAGLPLVVCGEAAAGASALIGIRPENVTLSALDGKRASSARNSFHARVSALTRSGPLCKVKLDCGFPLTALITANSARELDLGVGSLVEASVKATAIWLIRTGERRDAGGNG